MTFVYCVNAINKESLLYIEVKNNPSSIKLKLTDRRPYKIIQISSNEILIALKNIDILKDIEKIEPEDSFIKNIKVDSLPDDVLSILIETKKSITGLNSNWGKHDNTLLINLNHEKGEVLKSNNVVKKIQKDEPAVKKPEIVKPKEKDSTKIISNIDYKENHYKKNKKKGNLDDIIEQFSQSKCLSNEAINSSLNYCKKEDWYKAYDDIIRYIETNSNQKDKCFGDVNFLKAYILFKMTLPEDTEKLLKLVELFNDNLIFFPNSEYMPYAILALGNIHVLLNNEATAKGYFKIIADKYINFTGRPEALLHLAQIYTKTKNLKNMAVEIFKDIIAKYPESDAVVDARIGLGKSLSLLGYYNDSLKILNSIISSYPQKAYESKDLLLFLGENLYKLEKFKEARETLIKAYNYFPELATNPMLMAKIADSYTQEKDYKNSLKMHRLVMEKFPGTDGYVMSAMKYAQFDNNDKDKDTIYNKILKEFPNNPASKVALLKLAELKFKDGNYEESITMGKDLIISNVKLLEKNAISVVTNSFRKIFAQMYNEKRYPEIVERFLKEKSFLSEIRNPEIFLIVGKSYLNGHIYEKACDILNKAYEYYPNNQKPSDLFFSFGVALQGIEKFDEALKLFNYYVQVYPKEDNIPDTYFRIGQIKIEQEEYAEAIKNLKLAYANSKINEQKAYSLIAQAKSYKAINNIESSITLLIDAINFLASNSEKNIGTIFKAYKELGTNYSQLQMYIKAADSYAMAMKFIEKEKSNNDLRFIIGESYQKGNETEKATKVYKEIVALGDIFWSKLAEEKLKSIDLEKKIKNS